jgi:hypothetical protein
MAGKSAYILLLQFLIFVKCTYAGTGSARDSGLLFLVIILFLAFLLFTIYVFEQTKKFFHHLLNPDEPDLGSDLPISDINGS